ncbi:hypothetical protein [Paracoccus siganidrum]|uniref:Uncharacterized protein n=1 Tax=Paracoccus siganidrum TaxID=1276757 RepID=A0A419A3Q1_9RHOB|nr:hypothetical protein [Paracoccus siganidrum]RJL08404.1 hypothetical protein D3P05_16165 [Paracoccus siganidrum]RMC39315.1 hypothetical protein C9E82_04875 [Paracoccus siganidrum]
MAGLQIVIPGADFSGSGIPRNTRYLPGTDIPAYDALGVWALSEGTAGSVYTGEFANLVPGGPSARLLPGWAAPTMRNFGTQRGGFSVESVDGTFIDTRVSAARSAFTMAGILRTRPKHGTVTPYNLIQMLTSDDMNNLPASNAGNISMLTGLWSLGSNLNDGQVGQLVKFGAAIANVDGSSSTIMPAFYGQQNQWNAVGISIDGHSGEMVLQTLTARGVVTDAGRGNTLLHQRFVTELAQRGGNFLFGAMPNGGARDSSGPIADFMCAGVWGNSKTEGEMEAILRGLAKIAIGRGVTVSGY